MGESKPYDLQETQSIAERLLTETFGKTIRLAKGETLADRSHVFRFQMDDAPPDAPFGVIVKRARVEGLFNPDDADRYSPAARLFNDWAGLEFLNQVMEGNSIAPQFYAGGQAAGLFVMEDLGEGTNPADVLLHGVDSDAELALTSLMASLGKMHAATAGKEEVYAAIRGKLGRYVNWHHEWNIAALHAFAETLDLQITSTVQRDIEQVANSIQQPRGFLVYTHGDPCPDNWLKTGDRLRLFDFEMGSFRHALTDGIYPHILFPSCWCVNRLPEGLVSRLDSIYRIELAKGCPEASDDRLYYNAVVDAAAYMTLITCTWPDQDALMKADSQWGIASIRQRILTRCPLFARFTHRYHHLEALGEFMAKLAERLRARWTDTEPLPLYPAFRVPAGGES
jgi:hypothetical protein